jgi:hypothetical protein
MKARKRNLVILKVEHGTAMGGRCSVCHRPFEVELGNSGAVSQAKANLWALFEQHACDEDFSQAALRVVRQATDK